MYKISVKKCKQLKQDKNFDLKGKQGKFLKLKAKKKRQGHGVRKFLLLQLVFLFLKDGADLVFYQGYHL